MVNDLSVSDNSILNINLAICWKLVILFEVNKIGKLVMKRIASLKRIREGGGLHLKMTWVIGWTNVKVIFMSSRRLSCILVDCRVFSSPLATSFRLLQSQQIWTCKILVRVSKRIVRSFDRCTLSWSNRTLISSDSLLRDRNSRLVHTTSFLLGYSFLEWPLNVYNGTNGWCT